MIAEQFQDLTLERKTDNEQMFSYVTAVRGLRVALLKSPRNVNGYNYRVLAADTSPDSGAYSDESVEHIWTGRFPPWGNQTSSRLVEAIPVASLSGFQASEAQRSLLTAQGSANIFWLSNLGRTIADLGFSTEHAQVIFDRETAAVGMGEHWLNLIPEVSLN